MKKIIKKLTKKSKNFYFNKKSYLIENNKSKIDIDKYFFMSEVEKKKFLYHNLQLSLTLGKEIEIEC